MPGKVIGPGAQTSRPGDAGPVKDLRGGMASRAAFIFLLWYYPNLYPTGHGSPQCKDPVSKSFSLKTAYRRRASGNGVSDYYDPAYGINDFGNYGVFPGLLAEDMGAHPPKRCIAERTRASRSNA